MRFLNKHRDLFLLKLFSVNSIGVVIRSILGFISQKIIALYLGPEGMALVGNLRNAFAMLSLGSTMGVEQGLLTYQAEFNEDSKKLNKLYSTSMAYSLIGSIIVSLVLFFGATYWSESLFRTPKYSYLFIILGFTIPFTALYNLCFAILNGKSDYKKATVITFVTYAIITALVIFLVFINQLSGALLAIALTPIAQMLTFLFFLRKEIDLFRNIKIRFSEYFTNKLLVFIIISFVAVILSNLVDIRLRNHLIKQLSIEDAGYWTSMWNFSNYYLSFMTGVYSLYVLPKFTKVKTLNSFIKELKHIYRIVIPFFCIMFIAIYLFREPLIKLFYTKDFMPMKALFKWQLLGDLVKIISVIIAYQFIAKKTWKLFIITETISFVLLYIFGVYFVKTMGVEGMVFAHFLRYVVYLVIIVFLIPRIFKKV